MGVQAPLRPEGGENGAVGESGQPYGWGHRVAAGQSSGETG